MVDAVARSVFRYSVDFNLFNFSDADTNMFSVL